MTPYKLSANQSIQLLLQGRWFVLFIGFVGTLLIEFYEHGQNWMNRTFWVESGFYGLVIPVSVWFSLTGLAHSLAHRAKSEYYLAHQRSLRQRLIKFQDWTELTDFIAHFPRTLLPLDQTALYIYDHRQAKFIFTAGWGVPSPDSPLSSWSHHCRTCATFLSPKLHPFTGDVAPLASYCLPLFYEQLLVGVIRLRCLAGQSLTSEQIEFLNATAPEVALALIIGMAYPRQIAQARTEARQLERRYIAYLLHNSLAQQIGYLHLSLDRLATDPQLRASFQVELDHMREAAGEAYELTRSILSSLQTGDQTDISELIRVHAQHLAQRSGLHLAYVTEGDSSVLEPQVSHDLFSLVREGLHNIEKHACARQMRITLRWSPDLVSLELMDDGCGFDLTRLSGEGHYGLTMMRERVTAWRGEFQIASTPGTGTTLKFQIPLPAQAAALLEAA